MTWKEIEKTFGKGTKIYFHIIDTFGRKNGYFLCYILDILENTKEEVEWVSYSDEVLQEEWCLSKYAVQKSRKFFTENGILEVKKENKNFWIKINFDILDKLTENTPKRLSV